ncbi:carcinoembryonic antigen-related cell adhesion molecule 5 [Myripristis murdjan]|uniref:carcinoembryonic antigen-related cell adhesion molecule 5 n=1 Tax=Myripristis murdjan TaxID=586833 RepID=UPI0011760429|nr:carcinoembryonic antigen-related cell adhesion molecule 5-like [Myripristis murdjan]
MWLIKAFGILSFTALCASQTSPTSDYEQTMTPPTTQLPIQSVTPTLTLDPPAGQIYQGESAGLSCGASSSSPDWTYLWYHKNQETLLSSSDPSLTSYTITPATLANSGTYWCKIKRGEDLSEFSNPVTLAVTEPPKPVLKQETRWLDVFPSETVELSCKPENSDWTLTWHKDGQPLSDDPAVSLAADGSKLTIIPTSKSNSGNYVCRGQHKGKPVTTGDSNSLTLRVYENKPKPVVTQSPSFDKMYSGEPVSFTCRVDSSSGWEYVWYQNAAELTTGPNYTVNHPTTSNNGQYWCQAKRGETPFETEKSETKTLQFSDPPVPSLERKTQWPDVFQSEKVELSCVVAGSSDWTFTWRKDGAELQKSSSLSLDAEGSLLTILSATQTDQGIYTCQGHHKNRKISTGFSNTVNIKVDDKPKPILSKDPGITEMYVGETWSISCKVHVSSGWEYLWYKDGQQLPTSDSNKTISPLAHSDGGVYKCKATRGKTAFFTDDSEEATLHILVIPVPSLERQTPWPDVFPSERVEFTCKIEGSSDWTYSWYQNDQKIKDDQSMSLSADGSSLNMSITAQHEGHYTCNGQHKSRPVETEPSNAESLTVYPNNSKPVMTQNPNTERVYSGESVSFSCAVELSSDWEYLWYKNGSLLSTSGDRFNIDAVTSADNGTYECMARRGKAQFNISYSEGRTIQIFEIPTPTLTRLTQWSDVFHKEYVELSCDIHTPSDWTYVWFKNGTELSGSNEATLSIQAASDEDAGKYRCRGRHKTRSRSVSTKTSLEFELKVYERPKAVMTLLTGWSQVFSTDSLLLKCEVQENQRQWNYTWFKETEQIPLSHSEKYTVTPKNDPDQSQYTCKGVRTERPFYSMESEPLKTKNLLLKRRVLLSISGCLFFGIIAVFIGCIVLRLTRKQDVSDTKPEESNLFLTMAELKARDDAPNPLVEYITEADLNAPAKDGDNNGTICSESTPLPITSPEDQAVTPESVDTAGSNGGLMSFKQ